MRKLLSLSDPSKTRPYHPPKPMPSHNSATIITIPHSLSPSPASHPRSAAHPPTSSTSHHSHERSHSDTGPVAVDLNAESSSVTSLNNIPLRKSHTSGSVTSSDSSVGSFAQCNFDPDSGHVTDSRSSSSVEGSGVGYSPPSLHRRFQQTGTQTTHHFDFYIS